ncbi:mucin, partial [Thraustotheca clavata]
TPKPTDPPTPSPSPSPSPSPDTPKPTDPPNPSPSPSPDTPKPTDPPQPSPSPSPDTPKPTDPPKPSPSPSPDTPKPTDPPQPSPSPSPDTPKPTDPPNPSPSPSPDTPKPTDPPQPSPSPSPDTPKPTDPPQPSPSPSPSPDTPKPTDPPQPSPSPSPDTPKPTDPPKPSPSPSPDTPKPTDPPQPSPSPSPDTPKPTDPPQPSPSPSPDTPKPTDPPQPSPSPSPDTPKPTDPPVPSPSPSPDTPKPSPTDPNPPSPVPSPSPSPDTPKPSPTDPTPPSPVPSPSPSPDTPKPVPSPTDPTPPSPVPSPSPSPDTPKPVPSPTDPTPPSPVPSPSQSPDTPKPAPSPTDPTPPSPVPSPVPSPSESPSPSGATPVPTQVILVTPAPTETKSAIIDSLISQTNPVSSTQPPTPDPLLLNKDTPAPTIPVVVTVDPGDVDKINKINNLGTTAPPSLNSGSASKAGSNDHSENKNRGKSGSESTSTVTKRDITTGTESSGLQTVRYIVSSIVGISIVILAFFQFIAMNPSYIAPDSLSERLLAPNSWELPLFVAFIQQAQTLSLARNAKVPQLFYMNFMDSLSWLNFLIRGSSSSSDSATSVSSVQLVSGPRRLTDTGYDASGFTQFAIRADVKERDWFVRVWVVFIIVIAIILLFVIGTALFARWASQRGNPFHSETSDSHKRSVSLRSISRRLLGMCVLVGYFVLLPLSMISMFEILQDSSTDGFPHANAILAIVTYLIIGGVIIGGMYWIFKKTEAGLSKWQTRVVFGLVYTNYTYQCRLYFAAAAVVQVLSGVFIACITANALTQLLVLIALHVVYIASMVILQPFDCPLHFRFSIGVELLIITIFGLACGMTGNDLTKNMQSSLSYVIIILLCLVFLLMFIRQLVMLWTYASGWAKESNESYTGIPTLNDHEIESGPGQYTISLHDTESNQNSGSFYTSKSPKRDDSPTNTIRIVDAKKQIQI